MSARTLSLRKAIRWFGLMVVVALSTPSATLAADQVVQDDRAPKPSYRLGVFPYLPALTIDRLYGPVAEAFSFELDRLVKLRTKTTFESFETAMADQSYDIIFVHPFFLVEAMDRHGYMPLARLAKPLTAILTVRDDSPATSLHDLVGGTIGLPPKLAAVSDLIRAALIDAKLRPGLDVGIRHFRNKASCLQAVLTGAVNTCGLPAFVLSQVVDFGEHALRTVFKTPPVSHFAFAVHQRVPEEERQKLQDLLLSWSDIDSEVVQLMGLNQGFVQAHPEDYADVRARKAHLQMLAQR
ncbi:MAG: phosphate/phosphite/phosphonate ABC transporter substrate-binding protein [Geminicoccaceae bacterium]